MSGMEAVMAILAAILSLYLTYTILCLIGTVVLLSKTKRNKWFGLIPIVSTYELYTAFWSKNMFLVYFFVLLSRQALSFYMTNHVDSMMYQPCNVASVLFGFALLGLDVSLMNQIRLAFGRGMGWVFFLVFLYPMAAIILGCTGHIVQTHQQAADTEEAGDTDIQSV